MSKLMMAGVVALALLAAGRISASPADGVFHLALIDEVITSYNGDTGVQFVEIRMETISQNFVKDSVLGAFDAGGSFAGDVLVVPGNVANSGPGVRWLMATQKFQDVTGLAPDFIMPAGLPTAGGMVCWGAPGAVPPDPATWDHADPENYVDCLAYGTYSGPSNSHVGTPTPLDGDGHSLQRISDTNDNATDFECADPATPENNTGGTDLLPATTPCPAPPRVCNGVPATIVGTDGPDVLIGTAGADVVVAFGGNDIVFTGGGNDIICAGDGDDLVIAGAGFDILLGEAGMDILAGGAGPDVCVGGPDPDTAFACELTFGVP